LYSRSAYGTDKTNMRRENESDYQYPCVYTTIKDGTINLWHSNTKSNGHFDVPKVIFTNGGATTLVVDETGEYGLTQFAYGIIDEPENLPLIKKAMEHPDFIKLMKFADGISSLHKYNRKAITLFRKDFWKEFV